MSDLVAAIRAAMDDAEAQANVWAQDCTDHFTVNDAGRALLRHIAADRKILNEHAPDRSGGCESCMWVDGSGGLHQTGSPCATVLALAEGYVIEVEQ